MKDETKSTDKDSKETKAPKVNRAARRRSNRGKSRSNKPSDRLDKSRSNNPGWYFTDERLADQVSQLSFQNLAGYPIQYSGFNFDVPNIIRVAMNPSPGVQTSAYYNTPMSQSSAINMVGFRLYSKLSAFTGRTQSYAPQDVTMMELAFAEVISMFEFIRRAFGVAYTMNMRNRDYPHHVIQFGMLIDADDLFSNYSNYRTKFNTLVTLFNQLPIPKNVAYFQKCAAIFQRIYLDAPSNMAQTLIPVPYTTWELDEQSYSGGSILKTVYVVDVNTGVRTMAAYLNILENMISALLNSTTLQIVYTDLINYASKQSMEFWKMDYLFEGYTVVPEYDQNYLLQLHNATITGSPNEVTFVTGPYNCTPDNDVYPDVNHNTVYYNPAFATTSSIVNGMPRTGDSALIDMMTDSPSLTDRVEVTRLISIVLGTPYVASNNLNCYIDTALPDHYIVHMDFEQQTSNLGHHLLNSTIVPAASDFFKDMSAQLSNIDWAPRIYEWDANNNVFTGRYTSDVNFYTTVDREYIRKLHDFVGLALYDVR